MKVVEFQRENWRDASKTLRKIADQLDSGELPACSIGVLAMRSPEGQVEIFGFGLSQMTCRPWRCSGWRSSS